MRLFSVAGRTFCLEKKQESQGSEIEGGKTTDLVNVIDGNWLNVGRTNAHLRRASLRRYVRAP
jgi:hypothetical protein